MKETPESPLPTKEQELLLKAALLSNDEALNAWEEWKKLVDFEGYFDQGSFRLLPLLYKNLLHHGITDQYLTRLKAIYLQSWYKNHKLFYESAKIVRFLNDAGIRSIALKGTALSILAYKDCGTRPMADFDLLVPVSQASIAIDLLKGSGWQPENNDYIDFNLQYGRSMTFTNEVGFELDLHWHPFFESLENNNDMDFWDRSVPLKLSDAQMLSLCPTDMLLHVIVHGMRWNAEPPIRWIPDSIVLLNTYNSEIDWPRFIDQVKKYKVVLQVREALNYLIIKLYAAIPEFVMPELNKIRVSTAERLVYHNAKKNEEKSPDGFFGKLYLLFLVYLRQSNKVGILRQMTGFIKFMRFRTAGKNYLAIIWHYISKK